MTPSNSRGALLCERLGIESLGREGHDVKAACVACDSSDGLRVHTETGIAYCYVCNGHWSRLQLATHVLRDEGAAWALLEEIHLEQPRHRANGHANGFAIDPLEAVAKAKGITAGALKVYGAIVVNGKVELPAYGPDGQQCSTFTMPPAGKGLFAKGKKAGLFFPHTDGAVRLPQPGETWHAVEGPKDAAALHQLGKLAVGLNTCALAARFARLFAGVDVVLVPDRDTAGIEGAEKSARALFGKAASIRIAHLPAEVKDKGGEDVRDILRRGGGRDLVEQAIGDAAEWKPPSDENGSLPDIIVGVDEARVVDEAIASLAARPEVFQRGNELVHIVTETRLPKGVMRPPHVPRIASIPTPRLRELLASSARYFVCSGEQVNPVHPPAFAVSAVAARGTWSGIRCLEFVTETPVLRPDGTIFQTSGYDADLAAIYQPNETFPAIDPDPSQQDARFAADELFEVVEDFPFESEAHRSAWLAAVLTPFARPAFHGPAPLMLVDANVRGAGKSLLIDAIGSIASGRGMARMANLEDDAAWRKQITSIAMAGDPLVLIDNIGSALGSPSLDGALTATEWKDRVLGENTIVTCPLNVTWFATGNNVVLKADTARRVLHIRLDSSEEKPEERSGFKHPDLLAWLKANRPRLVAAALTILRAYCRAGRPRQDIPPWGSFEGWSDLIRGAVAWLGSPDPGMTRANLEETADSEASQLRQLIAGWEEIDTDGTGCRIHDVLESLADKNNEHRFGTLRSALAEAFGSKPGTLPSTRQIGAKFHRLRRRLIGGKCLDRRLDSSKTAHWFVSGPGSSGSSGS
jgi:hypothetical protein